MYNNLSAQRYKIQPDEKVSNVIAYTNSGLFWGEIILKEQLRVSTWLRTAAAPDRVCMFNARMIQVQPNGKATPILFPELYIPASEILVFHLVPPDSDPLDYDPSEPNRKMEPITVMTAHYRLDATIRIASITNLARFLDVVKEPFTALYNVEITCPIMPALGCMKVPYAIARQQTAIFTYRN